MTGQHQRKKREERSIVEHFIAANPQLGLLEVIDSESPDFLCQSSQGLCGIELQRFVFSPKAAHVGVAINSYREQLQSELCKAHRERGLPPMNISVYLISLGRFRNRGFRELLRTELLDLVAQTKSNGWPPLKIESDALPESLHTRGVTSVTLIGGPGLSRVCWSFPHAVWLPDATPEMIQHFIDEKNPKVVGYREKVNTAWLVIAAGQLGLDSMLEFTPEILSAFYTSSFDRAFLFHRFGPKTHELRISA